MTTGRRSRIGCGRAWVAAVALAATGCRTTEVDLFRAGQAAMAESRFAEALRCFDGVPVSDLRYPEARLAAAGLERRLRRLQEMVLLGLRLRGEWRDEEALVAFRSALSSWPGHADTEALVEATELRQKVLLDLQTKTSGALAPIRPWGVSSPLAVEEPIAPRTEPRTAPAGAVPHPDPDLAAAEPLPPAAPPRIEPPPAVPLGESGPSTPAVVPSANAHGVGVPGSAASVDEVAVELARIESRLVAGDLERVLEDLTLLHRMRPADPRIGLRLARLLQQRGLVRYGQGFVAGAITDWQRAMDLDPGLDTARVLFELAMAEIAAAKQTR